ncbi:MAG: aminoglycoside 6-adenylyltransferase, partial [Gaiellaceae bacterium]
MPSVETLLGSVLAWAQRDDNVIALITTGSASRSDARRDEFSDLDVEVIARDPEPLLIDDRWFMAFGEVWVVLRFDERQYPTRLVIYDGGSKVDFTVAGVRRLEEMNDQLDPLYERGYRVLLDKERAAGNLPPASGRFPARAAPTQTEYDATVEEFWFEAAHLPWYLARDDLWVVKFRDWTMKTDLLKMLEWRASVRSEAPVDVWHIGTRMKEWVDEATWRQIHDVYARFDQQDSWRALLASADLFAQLSRETAEANGLTYPVELERHVRDYL